MEMQIKTKNFTTLYGMVQFSQTSWQNGTLSDTLDILRYAPMTLSVGTNAVIYYTLPKSIEPGEFIRYTIVAGFRKISWTGIIGAVNAGKTENVIEIAVRLGDGPFRGFTAKHKFDSYKGITTCFDDMTFQGCKDFAEDTFSIVMASASMVYAISAREMAREQIAFVEAKKRTQAFEALDQSATAG